MTSDARRGYSLAFAREVEAADGTKLGVQLGRLCIEKNIPIAQVAERFKVSRTAVYAWFRGEFAPAGEHAKRIRKLLDLAQTESA